MNQSIKPNEQLFVISGSNNPRQYIKEYETMFITMLYYKIISKKEKKIIETKLYPRHFS